MRADSHGDIQTSKLERHTRHTDTHSNTFCDTNAEVNKHTPTHIATHNDITHRRRRFVYRCVFVIESCVFVGVCVCVRAAASVSMFVRHVLARVYACP